MESIEVRVRRVEVSVGERVRNFSITKKKHSRGLVGGFQLSLTPL
jgi:hypothetical protein